MVSSAWFEPGGSSLIMGPKSVQRGTRVPVIIVASTETKIVTAAAV
jgi:hypothetical protein